MGLVETATKVPGGFMQSAGAPIVLWSYHKSFHAAYSCQQLKLNKKKHGLKRVVLDCHKVHSSRKVAAWCEANSVQRIFVPKRSPDVSPLDFAMWRQVESHMAKKKRKEPFKKWFSRLKRTARRVCGKPYISKVLRNFVKRLNVLKKKKVNCSVRNPWGKLSNK